MIQQKKIRLPFFSRGYHLITHHVLKKIAPLPEKGILHLFIQHSSAALTINEDADPSVRSDFESIINRLVPENLSYYTHTMEGSDDMPAHIKASLFGASVSVPIIGGKLSLGTWQGIYLCEFRNRGGERRLVSTVVS